MENNNRAPPIWRMLMVILLVLLGCNSGDERLVDLSRQSADRQAEQNRLVEANNQQVIDATKRLVDADAQGRRENIELHSQIEAERSGIDQQRDSLEQERRQIADERNRDPIIAESILAAADLMAAILPLIVCVYLLSGLFHKADDEAMAEVLIAEMVAQKPFLAELDGMFFTARSHGTSLPSTIQASPKTLRMLDPPCPTMTEAPPSPCAVVVEGLNDVEFLRRISGILHAHHSHVPDLSQLEQEQQLIFVTSETGTVAVMSARCAGCRQFHLLDREMPPVDQQRKRLIKSLNQLPDCRAALTSKRTIENYLHPSAIDEASGLKLVFGDFEDVPKLAAMAKLRQDSSTAWEDLSPRARRRLRDKAKKWLNRAAVDRMTPERLAERDRRGEVQSWLKTIAELAGTSSPSAASAG